MIGWMDYGNYHYAAVKNNIVIMTQINGVSRFRPPLGKKNPELMKQILTLAQETESDFPLGLIDTQMKTWIAHHFPHLHFLEHRDYFEYVYQSSDLADLPGGPYRKIRNRLNKFIKNHRYTIASVTEDNMQEIRSFLRRWCLWKDCASDPFLEHEKKAILFSMDHFFELGLSGIITRVNEAIEAIAVYETMNANTAVVHFEKGSPDYDGIYKLINAETAKHLQKKFQYINRQSDMGYSGLRQAKMGYHPHHMVKVYHVPKDQLHF